ncbi:hypothetical protein B7R22_16630 [Subtercola boreus]|uniref:Uncharacterized protein n=1 Tax=Subtercola boreus TaxID=120213 RepID=A0A3E0VS95_9MICO|nr:hypothetical protein [Subtercola boreus]RFA12253.1 hypothetical protein B7R22_16630 [Subtercola boreus]
MGKSGNENAILTGIASVEDSEVCFIPDPTDDAVAYLSAMRDSKLWIESERPDFYSNELRLAVEVMRVDDHPPVGKLHNPTLAREAHLEREIRSAFPSMDRDIPISVIADTGLPSEEDHNFTAYRDAFARVVGDHAARVTAYRENQPGHALAFLVHDESSAYARVEASIAPPSNGTVFPGRAHFWFLDFFFIQIIAESGVDFVFWHTPYKHMWRIDAFGLRTKVELPTLIVYDVAAMTDWDGPMIFEPSQIVSVEE